MLFYTGHQVSRILKECLVNNSGKIVHTGCLEDAGNLHCDVPRMVRSDSIDSIDLNKTAEDEEADEDTAQVSRFKS